MSKSNNNGKKLGAYWIPESVLESFKKFAADKGLHMSTIVTQLIEEYLAKNAANTTAAAK
jgi:predicted DNA binding CopG/RHH family protein